MAISQSEILRAITGVPLPDGRSLLEAGAVPQIKIDGETVRVRLMLRSATPVATEALRTAVERAVGSLAGVERVEAAVDVELATAGPAPASKPQAEQHPSWNERIPGVKRVVAVASGKGGVGKSTVTTNLALALAGAKQRVGLLDADIYGPSQQLMTGASDRPTGGADGTINPVVAPGGVKVMSFGFIVDPDQPVIWRGPMLQKALEQMIGEVLWGDLDYLLVDLPPGTGDVALTLCQNLTIAGAVIVTTPQDVALIDARKALHMFRRLEVPVLGIVENMSHFVCPSCGHVEHIFGQGGGQRTASELDIPFLGGIPLDPAIVSGGDSGRPVVVDRPESAAAKAFEAVAKRVVETLDGRG